MPKMSTELTQHRLGGPTMGSRWEALFHAGPAVDTGPLAAAMAEAVGEVDRQMSTWKPDSDLMRLNAAPPGEWIDLPEALVEVLAAALEIGRLSDGAFDIGLGDVVAAWGFGPAAPDPDRIRAALATPRQPAHEKLELDQPGRRARKLAPLQLDLSGIAKGYGVDRLARTARRFGLADALVSIDGEVRAVGGRPDGTPWSVAIEEPDHRTRRPLSVIALQDGAAATSGDYRQWVDVGPMRLSHTMDPARGGPLPRSPASVTVLAATCMQADAWATALMVMGTDAGAAFARQIGLDALFIDRIDGGLQQTPVGPLFEDAKTAPAGSGSAAAAALTGGFEP